MEKQLQPTLRFPEFEGYLKNVYLKDIAKFSKGKNISKADIREDGAFGCIRYGELYTTYGEVIDKIVSRTNIDEKNLVFSEANDIIIPASGESALDIATASCVLKDGIALGGDLNIIKTKENGVFLSYYFNNKKKDEIAKKSQGISVIHIYSDHLKSLNLNLPSLPEQQKIADYLSTIDEKLTLLEEKKTELSRYKKAMMQKLFSQEIRFKDENGNDFSDWEEKRLGEVASFNVLKNKANLILPVLTNSAEYGVVNQEDFFDNQIANDKSLDSYIVLDKNEFVYNPRISKHAPFGPININKLEKGLLSPLYSVFKIREDLMNLVYVEYYFKTSKWYKYMAISGNQGARSDRMAVNKETLNNIPISKPSFPEQQKIADFLSAIDESIDKVSEQIKETQSFKKAMLQQMFV